MTIAGIEFDALIDVSTHTPPARCDLDFLKLNVGYSVSTHTPPARCDGYQGRLHQMRQVSTHTPPARCDKSPFSV